MPRCRRQRFIVLSHNTIVLHHIVVLSTTTFRCSVLSVPSPASSGHAAEEYLPENVRRLREHKGLPQSALAKAMSDRGWSWHQQTVYRVENGKQGVSLGEATDLAEILGVPPGRLTWAGPEASEAALVDRAAAILHQSWNELADSAARLHAARDGAGRAIARSEGSEYGRVRETCAGLRAEHEHSTVKSALAEGWARWEREAAG